MRQKIQNVLFQMLIKVYAAGKKFIKKKMEVSLQGHISYRLNYTPCFKKKHPLILFLALPIRLRFYALYKCTLD